MSRWQNKNFALVFPVLVILLCSGCQVIPAGPSVTFKESAGATDLKLAGGETASRSDSRVLQLLKDGSLQAAENQLRLDIKDRPSDVASVTNLGLLLAKLGRVDEAAEQLSAAVALDRTNCPAHLQLASIHLARYAIDDAEAAYRTCLQSNPNHPVALLNLGILLELYRGELNEAIAYYSQYQRVTVNPDHSVERWKADLHRRVGVTAVENQVAEVRQ